LERFLLFYDLQGLEGFYGLFPFETRKGLHPTCKTSVG
jgi:hypothetical protein